MQHDTVSFRLVCAQFGSPSALSSTQCSRPFCRRLCAPQETQLGIQPHKQTEARSTNTLGMALWVAFDFLGSCRFVSALHSVKPLFCDVHSCHTTPGDMDIMAMTGYLTWTCTHDTLPCCVRHGHDTLCSWRMLGHMFAAYIRVTTCLHDCIYVA